MSDVTWAKRLCASLTFHNHWVFSGSSSPIHTNYTTKHIALTIQNCNRLSSTNFSNHFNCLWNLVSIGKLCTVYVLVWNSWLNLNTFASILNISRTDIYSFGTSNLPLFVPYTLTHSVSWLPFLLFTYTFYWCYCFGTVFFSYILAFMYTVSDFGIVFTDVWWIEFSIQHS